MKSPAAACLRRLQSRDYCVALAAQWSLLGGGSCAVFFVGSVIPAVNQSSDIPASQSWAVNGLILTFLDLWVWMVPLRALIPVPLLFAGRGYLRRSSLAGARGAGTAPNGSAAPHPGTRLTASPCG